MEQLSVGNGGWVRYESDEAPAAVMARLQEVGGRLEVREVYVATDGPGLTADALRQVPIGRIETIANSDPAVRDRLAVPGPDLRTAASHFASTFGGQGRRHWARDMIESQVPGSGIPKAPKGADPARRKAPAVRPGDLRLEVPPARPYGEDFYRLFADVYRLAAMTSRNPAGMIADANEIDAISTVHRWVRVARRHGFLPPAHQGKAG